jgi:hypothetical protein
MPLLKHPGGTLTDEHGASRLFSQGGSVRL